MLTVALCKGKLIEPTLELFAKAGYGAVRPAADSRRLLVPCPEIGMTFLIVRPTDAPLGNALTPHTTMFPSRSTASPVT